MPRSRNGEANARETLILIKERQRAKLNNATAAEGQPRKNVISGTKKLHHHRQAKLKIQRVPP